MFILNLYYKFQLKYPPERKCIPTELIHPLGHFTAPYIPSVYLTAVGKMSVVL